MWCFRNSYVEQLQMIKYEPVLIKDPDDYNLIYTKLPASFRKNPYVPQWIELLHSLFEPE